MKSQKITISDKLSKKLKKECEKQNATQSEIIEGLLNIYFNTFNISAYELAQSIKQIKGEM